MIQIDYSYHCEKENDKEKRKHVATSDEIWAPPNIVSIVFDGT